MPDDDTQSIPTSASRDQRRLRGGLPHLGAGLVGAFAIGESTANEHHAKPSDLLLSVARPRVSQKLLNDETLRVDEHGHLIVQLSTSNFFRARRRMHAMTRALVRTPLVTPIGRLHVDVGSSWTRLSGSPEVDAHRVREVSEQAEQSLGNRDLVLRPGQRKAKRTRPDLALTPLLITLSVLMAYVVPFFVMTAAYSVGVDLSWSAYVVLVAAMLIMAISQLAEGINAIRIWEPPRAPPGLAPRATAIIAAYLPNEAATIMETLHSFLDQKYSGGLQIILAYNTPMSLPIEDELRRLAKDNPELRLIRVAYSRSKADNVNAALASVEGEFVGIFDADHHPMQGAFERAWRWIASDADIVQGHCVIRNGEESGIARIVAVEFEQIYAVSHPGRQKLHGFGVFGGSNGFWRTQLLREIRLNSAYLTEDIDSSIRAVRRGARIINDPGLLSRELAPVNARALWKQRMRWAQGWFQVTLRYSHSVATRGFMTPRQRAGMAMFLAWREVYPWLTALMWPVLAFFFWRDGTLFQGAPIWIITTLFTVSSGPLQVMFAYRLGAEEIRRHKSWWWQYAIISLLAYQEIKNLIIRVSQMRQFLGQDEWAITPRGHVERANAPRRPALQA